MSFFLLLPNLFHPKKPDQSIQRIPHASILIDHHVLSEGGKILTELHRMAEVG